MVTRVEEVSNPRVELALDAKGRAPPPPKALQNGFKRPKTV